jgi:iron complex outermembrane receptor protein
MSRYWLSILFFLLPLSLFASEILVNITVLDANKQPVAFAKVSLTKADDTGKRLSGLADESGIIKLPAENGQRYILNIAAAGYRSLTDSIVTSDTTTGLAFMLTASTERLNEVVVKAVRPLMRQEDDKTIIDPQSLVESSSSGFEVIEKTPGLFIDQDGNIYISSTTPAMVYINGRQMKLGASDIASLLKSLPPNAIEKIEILRTPSAKYEASSSGGVVNVVLKKGVKIGLTGQVYAGMQQGRYGNQYIGGNLSNQSGATTTYLNGGLNNRNYYEELTSNRYLSSDTVLMQFSKTNRNQQSGYVGYGISHEINEKWQVGWDGYFTLGNNKNYNSINNYFSNFADTLNYSYTNTSNPGNTFLSNQDASVKYKIDTAGSEWTTTLSHVYTSGNTDQDYETVSPGIYSLKGDGSFKSRQSSFTFQSDVNYKFPRKLSMEAGVNLAVISFTNQSAYFTGFNGNREQDNNRTNSYTFGQNVNAGYAQLSKTFFKDAILKAGLRVENTNMQGEQTIPDDTSFRVNRTDLFPYVYLSKDLFSMIGVKLRGFLVYRRSVARPSYDQLNPFPRFVDQFLTEAGNPNLKPQFTNTYEANVCVDEYPVFAVGINDKTDMITSVYYQDGAANREGLRTFDNIGKNREFYLKGVAGIPPGGKYFFIIGAQYNHNTYEGLYDGTPIKFSGDNWMLFTHHNLKIGDRTQMTLNGFWRMKGPMQFMQLGDIGRLNLSINRQFLDKKLTLTANIEDIFFTNNSTFALEQGNVNVSGRRITDSRRVGLNLRYNFGIRKKDEHRNMFELGEDAGK